MELSGEEKKLQALFSELKKADEETAPRFARVWNRATLKPRRTFVFHPAFVAVTVLLVGAAVSFAVWSRSRQQTPTAPMVNVELPPPVPLSNTDADKIQDPKPLSTLASSKGIEKPRIAKRPARRNSIQLAQNRKLTRDAKAITDWESPTSALLSSPSDELFGSLPQLNENANGLQSFLPSRPN